MGEAEANGFGAINKSLYSAVFPDKKKLISELNRWIYVYQIDKDGFHRHIKFWFFFFTWQFIIICKAMHSITVKKLNLCQIMLWMEHTFVFADF